MRRKAKAIIQNESGEILISSQATATVFDLSRQAFSQRRASLGLEPVCKVSGSDYYKPADIKAILISGVTDTGKKLDRLTNILKGDNND